MLHLPYSNVNPVRARMFVCSLTTVSKAAGGALGQERVHHANDQMTTFSKVRVYRDIHLYVLMKPLTKNIAK